MAAPLAPGLEEEQKLRAGGFSDDEIGKWKQETTQKLAAAGFSAPDIAAHFGQVEPDMAGVKALIKSNLDKFNAAKAAKAAAPAEGGAPKGPELPEDPTAHHARNFVEALEAGFQMSTAGMLARGKLPDLSVDHEDWGLGIASQIGQLAGDVPAMLAGGVAGTIGGATVGAAGGAAVAGPGGIIAGVPVGAMVGSASGAFALPAALRKVLVDHYRKGDIKDFSDFWARSSGAFIEAVKGGVTGAATSVTGGLAAGAAKAAGPVIQKGTQLLSEIATMATVGKAMEGHIPNARDFADTAVLVLGMHAVGGAAEKMSSTIKEFTDSEHAERVESKLHKIYEETGKTPEEVAADARENPVIMQELAAHGDDIPEQYKAERDPDLAKAGVDVREAETVEQDPKETNSTLSEGFAPVAQLRPMPEQPAAGDAGGGGKEPPGSLKNVTPGEGGGVEEIHPIDKRIVPGDGERKMMMSNRDRFYTAILDDLNPLNMLVSKLTDGKKISALQDPYVLARLTRGNFGRLQQVLENGPYEFNSFKQTGTPGMKKILNLFKDDLDGFRRYAVASRAIELNARGIETGIPIDGPEGAKVVVEAGAEKYHAAFKQLVSFQNDMILYLKDSGVLSEKAYFAMTEANKSYVPFFRLQDGTKIGKGAGKGFVVFNPTKKIEGSNRPIIDPIESVIRNTSLYIQLAERNRAMTALVDLAASSGVEGLVEKVGTAPARTATPKEGQLLLEQHGMEKDADLAAALESDNRQLAKGEIAVYKNGKREIYKVPEEVADAVNGLDAQTVGAFVKLMSKPAKLLRGGSVTAPEFFVKNVIRDQLTAFVLSKNGYIPAVDALFGASEFMKDGEHFQNWLKGGGANSSMVALDRDYISQNIFKLSKETGLMDKARNVVRHPIEALAIVSELTENMTRIGEFRKAAKGSNAPEDIIRGAYDAREVTLDFARIGAQTKAVNSIVAFWNANVQGVDRVAREMKERPVPTLAKAMLSVTLPSLALYAANHDDPRWTEVPRWQKDLFWIVMGKDTIYRIPKAHEVGLFFGSFPERALDAYFAENPRAFKDFQKSVFSALTPGVVPTIATPFIEHFANRNLFTGAPIIPAQLERIMPQEQYTPYTSETAKAIGQVIGHLPEVGRDFKYASGSAAAPAVIDNYLQAWTGNWGKYALKLSDYALQKAGVVIPPPKAADTLSDTPFFRAFVVRYPSVSSQSIQDFYERINRNETVQRTIEYLKGTTVSPESADKYKTLLLTSVNEGDMLNLDSIKTGLGQLAKTSRNIIAMPGLTPNDKRQLVDKLVYQMIEMSKIGNHILDEFEKSTAKAK